MGKFLFRMTQGVQSCDLARGTDGDEKPRASLAHFSHLPQATIRHTLATTLNIYDHIKICTSKQ